MKLFIKNVPYVHRFHWSTWLHMKQKVPVCGSSKTLFKEPFVVHFYLKAVVKVGLQPNLKVLSV